MFTVQQVVTLVVTDRGEEVKGKLRLLVLIIILSARKSPSTECYKILSGA
jgi:hypothetical protein